MRSFALVSFLALPLLTANIARADLVTFTASFSDGSKGIGSFHLTDQCVVCTANVGLDRFAFSVWGTDFKLDSITYFSDLNALSGSSKVGSEHFVFTLSGKIHYSDASGGSVRVLHGQYDIDETASSGASTEGGGPIVSVPDESSSVLLLATAFVAMAGLVSRKRRVV